MIMFSYQFQWLQSFEIFLEVKKWMFHHQLIFCFNFLLIFGEGMEGQIDSLVAHLG